MSGWRYGFLIGLFLALLFQLPGRAVAQTGGWLTVETSRFLVHYRPADITHEQAAVIGAKLEALHREIRHFLELEHGPARTRVYLMGEGELSGVTEEGIVVLRRDPHNHEYTLLAHQVTHVLMDPISRSAPLMLREGLATYMQERLGGGSGYPAYGDPLDRYCAAFLRLGILLPLARVAGPESLYAPTQRLTLRILSRWQAYLEAGSFTKYLITAYGVNSFKALYQGKSYEEVYGKSLAALEQEWLRERLAPLLTEPAPVMVPTSRDPRARKTFVLAMGPPDSDAAGLLPTPGEVSLHLGMEAEERAHHLFTRGQVGAAEEAFQEAARWYLVVREETRALEMESWARRSREILEVQRWEAAERKRALQRKERIFFALSLAFIAILWGAAMYARRRGDHEEGPHSEGEGNMDKFNAYVDANAERFIAELQEACRQPSISAQKVGLEEMAQVVLERLRRLGAEARLIEVEGAPPLVYGELGEGDRTLMFYNHYDVQPPEPLELWESDPFDPQIRQGALYARGASDNKGNLMARLQAIEAWLATRGELPLRVTFVVEGEEEVGSPHLAQFVAEHRELLEGADGCLWESGYKDPAERLVITLGLKGILYVELRAQGAAQDLHSSWATIVPNPAWRLVWALASLKDEEDRITLDGLMDHVAEPTPEEMEMLAAIPFEEEKLKADYGIPRFIRDLSGLELLKKHLFGPTCTICGFKTGYTGPGGKTVLPHEAVVKVDFRLVPDLTPELVMDLLRKHLDRRGFTDVEVVDLSGVRPAKSDPQAPIVRAAVEAARAVYGREPVVYPLMAGSGPMYLLCQGLGIPAFSTGVGHAGSNIHAPNENIRLTDYIEGIKYIGELIRRFGG